MECFFEQWLKGSPGKRLKQLAAVLQQYQTFPQLYIYSLSDHVVPHTSVEDFMEVQPHLGPLHLVVSYSALTSCTSLVEGCRLTALTCQAWALPVQATQAASGVQAQNMYYK